MQISITNGTLTSISETLSPNTGYALPTTIQVSGATSNYNSTTGAITLTNLTSTMSITAVGVATLIPPSIGNKDIVGAFVGNKQVKSMWLGNVKVYDGAETPPSGYDLTINFTGNMSPALRVYVNKTPVSFDSTDYDYEFYYENSPCIVSGLVANDYVYLLGQYGGRYDWTASSNVNCTYVDEEYGRFKVVISSDANASIDINFED